jgi:tetratricopeptide (TPR) repeat protein
MVGGKITASAAGPDPPEATLALALGRHRAGATAEADHLFRQALDAAPDDPAALFLYARFNAETGRADRAREILARLVALQPGHVEAHVALADLAERAGRQDEAMARYRQALEIRPGHAVALVKLASVLLDRGFTDVADLGAAIEVCRAAITLLPDPAAAHALLGRTLLAAGRAGEAVEAYRTAAALAPLNPPVFAGLALALLSAGDLEAALEVAETVTAVAPTLADGWYARGRALLLLHRPAPAAEAFAQGLQLTPDDSRLHLGLGDAYAEVYREREAIAHLARAAALDPDSKWAHANLGSVLYRNGELAAAEQHCRRALALDPDLPSAHRNLAGILAEDGRDQEARRHRDAAYAADNVEIHSPPNPRATVLVLTTCDSGNIPHRNLLPADRYARIDWFIEYATPGQAAALPPYDIAFNIIGDADYSDPTEAVVEAFVRRRGVRVLNDPARIGPTRRDRLPAHLAGIEGLVVPRAARLDPGAGRDADIGAWARAQGLEPPLLLRPIGSHGGRGLTLARSMGELEGFDAAQGAYATAFQTFASPRDGLFRKYRAIFVDRRPYPYHLGISDHWLVHYASSLTPRDPDHQAEEMRFLEDPAQAVGETAWAAIGAVGRRLDLDYAGLDFSILPDGRVLVFEANATMLVHREAEGPLARKNPYVERITSAFQALVEAR